MHKTLRIVLVFLVGFTATWGAGKAWKSWKNRQPTPGLEPPAVVDPVNVWNQDQVVVEYPANWKAASAPHAGADVSFTLESPGHCFAWVMVFDSELEPGAVLAPQAAAFESALSTVEDGAEESRPVESSHFTAFGVYSGMGRRLSGQMHGQPTTIRLFATRQYSRTFLVVFHQFDDDAPAVYEGFKHIEFSLRVKKRDDVPKRPSPCSAVVSAIRSFSRSIVRQHTAPGREWTNNRGYNEQTTRLPGERKSPDGRKIKGEYRLRPSEPSLTGFPALR